VTCYCSQPDPIHASMHTYMYAFTMHTTAWIRGSDSRWWQSYMYDLALALGTIWKERKFGETWQVSVSH